LSNSSSKTYIGYTNNFKKRISQHNCEISGGAKYTTAFKGEYGWTPIILITRIDDKSTALSLEWRMKKRRNLKGKLKPSYGLESRIRNIFEIIDEDTITSKSCKISDIQNLKIIINSEYKEFIDRLNILNIDNLPENIKIEYLSVDIIKSIKDGMPNLPNTESDTPNTTT
jgi:predicted GIY-YIG superfamily endonuclease